MRLAIMQPYIFPYIGYFQLINSVDKFVFYDDVTFIKQGWINRNNILCNGEKKLFTIPVRNISSNSLINETIVSDKPINWDKKFISTIIQSYKKAPYFKQVFPIIEKNINGSINTTISDVSKSSVISVLDYLGITKEITYSSTLYKNASLNAEHRVVDICLKESAKSYHNAIGGKELYEKSFFKSKGIELCFLEPSLLNYSQSVREFISGLSIIDVLMNNSIEDVNILLNKYNLA